MGAALKAKSVYKGRSPAIYCWFVTLIVWLTGVAMPLNMLKVSILSPVLMQSFSIGTDAMSWVMAMFYIIAAILAVPGAVIVGKIGYRYTFVLSLLFAVIGGFIGTIATDLTVFILSRVVEGVGFGLVSTAAVPAISGWFSPEKRGVPLGIWAMNVTMAFLVGPSLFSRMFEATGDYHFIWGVCLAFNAILLLVVLIFYRDAPFSFDSDGERGRSAGEASASSHFANLKRVVKNPAVWILGLVFLCEEIPFLGMSNFLTTYATQETDISMTAMSAIISVMAVAGCCVNPLAGKLSDVLGTKKKLMVLSCIGGTAYAWMVFQTTTVEGFVPVIALNTIAGGVIPVMIWSSIPKVVKRPEDIASATAIVLFFQQLAALFGSRILGMVVEHFGSFSIAGQYVMAPIFALGLVVVFAGWKKLP